jgi:aminoglycoside phosphotransferase family enzyme/predicted kinase
MTDDQAAVIAWLADPATHGAPVERVTTHISELFLTPERVYKLKRAVKLPYLDFSTAERRHRLCDAEVAVNRRTAPALYRGIAPIVRARDGGFAIGELGATPADAVDWLVVMRRFDESQLLDRLAARGALPAPRVRALADAIAAFHQSAEPVPQAGSAAPLRAVLDESLDELARRPEIFSREAVERLAARCRAEHAAVAALLDRRAAAGAVRRCHGDLHLRNVCLIAGTPTLFDALEFDEALATIDVLYDLAFLVMDLLHRDLAPAANQLLDRYLERRDEHDGLPAFGLFVALRAIVRAKIATTTDDRADATAYLRLAEACLAPARPRLIAIGGLSGTGKTTVARGLAPALDRPWGAVIVRSDVMRKQRAGVAPEARLAADAYTRESSAALYGALRARAGAILAAGHSVIVDAVHARPDEREAIEAVARDAGVPFVGLWLEAPSAALVERVEARTGDASDAGAAVVRAQLDYDLGTMTWSRVDAGGAPDDVIARARKIIRTD